MGRAYEVRKASIQKTGAQKAKLYSTFAKEIYLAAKSGIADIESNIKLKRIVDKAKKQQVPSDIVKRAIDKAKGSSSDDYQTVVYEGFGPGDSTLIIKTLTDNVNRTVSYIREAFNKVHKSLGVTNSVAFNYDYLAIIAVKSDKEEEIFNAILEAGIEIIDIENEEGFITVTAKPADSNAVKDIIEGLLNNDSFEVDEVGMYPKEKVVLGNDDKEQFERLYNMLDNIDDVVEIYHNVEN